MPITLFHGDQDNVIPYESAVQLKEEFGSRIKLITLVGEGHNGMTDNRDYQNALRGVL